MLGPIGVEYRSSSRSSKVFLDSCELLSVVLTVQPCHSIKPLDLGKWRKEVMWSM